MGKDRRERLIHIYCCRGATFKTILKMVAIDRSLKQVYEMNAEELVSCLNMHRKQAENFYTDLHDPTTSERLLRGQPSTNYNIVTRFDDDYPKLLQQIYDPPWVLFYRGDLSLAQHDLSLAVVGARRHSAEALPKMQKVITPLIRSGWCIVSGLAYGIDAMAHRLTLSEKGRTIAVLGSGVNRIYPSAHERLANIIAKKGLLLSEFLPDQPAQKWQFPQRNRLISGLTKGTLVVEAKKKSGSLITADQALEQGREVFAIPGSILNPYSEGTNQLIQQGAKLVLSSQDIKEELFPA